MKEKVDAPKKFKKKINKVEKKAFVKEYGENKMQVSKKIEAKLVDIKTKRIANKDVQKKSPKGTVAEDNKAIGEKISWKAGNMLYPLPAVMVSLTDKEGRSNIITLAWAGTICTNPPMLSVSIRPERYSYDIIKETGEFVVNLTTKALTRATDYCGVKSGRDVDKFKEMRLTKLESEKVKAVAIAESPVNIECKLREVMELGSHSLFIADIVNVRVDGKYMDDKGRFNLKGADLIAYSHGRYYELGKELGSFGYSIKKVKGRRKAGGGKK